MKDRQKKILKAAVKEYQRIGQPVSSQLLATRFRLDLSPATVRAEMLSLDEDGFLEQPHTSAGRIPTDKAWRFLLEELEENGVSENEKKQILVRIEKLHWESIKEVAQFLADCSKGLGISGMFGRMADFHEAGFKWLLDDSESLEGILKEFDSLGDDFDKFFARLDEPVKVFIGQENPIKYLRDFSLIVSAFENEDGAGLLGILGPKRMNYQKNKFVVEETRKRLKKRE
ncbi:MAG: hypothetical protein PHW33_00195 [Candidatus Portnoybacteria bacterium]|jgi:heat-inducible transcriptional repressor|nr:hypothetical protein [Candidatus Portnoybacteria bacterium]